MSISFKDSAASATEIFDNCKISTPYKVQVTTENHLNYPVGTVLMAVDSVSSMLKVKDDSNKVDYIRRACVRALKND